MTVYDLCEACVDRDTQVDIWDLHLEETVFCGTCANITDSDYEDYEIDSFEVDGGTITINIDTEE